MEDKRITNGQLTASSYYNHYLAPWHGRLNHRWSWSVRHRNNRQWFQVNFQEIYRIRGIGTQGRQDANQWVKSYTLSYGMNGVDFAQYRENGRVKVRWMRNPCVHLTPDNSNLQGKAAHEPRRPTQPELIPVCVAWSNWEYCYSPLDGMLVHRRVTPSSISPLPI